MNIGSNSALVDNDFLSKALEMEKSGDDIVYILSVVFDGLGVEAIMHPSIFEKEVLLDNPIIKSVFQSKIIQIPTWDDIHQNNIQKIKYYAFLVQELYKKLWGQPLGISDENIFTYWRRKSSLGEIHSISTCLLCGCSVFLSDDGDSQKLKNFAYDICSAKINVYNRETVAKILREGDTVLTRRKLRSFAHSR